MPNPYGRMGAPMVQPTKDELRQIIQEYHDREFRLRSELRSEKSLRSLSERKLAIAARLIGESVIEQALKQEAAQLEEVPA